MSFYKKYYRILDADVCIESDSESFLNEFDYDYGWFRTESLIPSLSFSVMLDGNEKDTAIYWNNQVFSLAGHTGKNRCAYQIILKEIFNNIREFILLHAGVVADSGESLILAGAPGLGKTTAVLELLKNGFTLYSDDFCPIHKITGLVHPFPRSLWKVADPKSMETLHSSRKNKIPLRPDELGYPVGDSPAKIKTLICLDQGELSGDEFYLLGIGIKNGDDSVICDLKKLDGVSAKRTDNEFSDWCVRYPQHKGLTVKIREILEHHKSGIWSVFREDPVSPDFSRKPVLTKIPVHEAAFRLIKDLKNEAFFNSTPSSLMMMLSAFLNDVSCYRLSVGNLDVMRKMLLSLSERQLIYI